MAKSPDISFLLQAAQSDAGQIALGSLASQKAVSSAVKELGAQLAEENRKTTDRLVSFAAQRRMTLSLTMNARDAATYYKLQHAPANKFDKEYLAAMAKDHKSNIKVFTKEAKKGEDEQIQNFAAGMVPALRDHVTRLQALRSEAKSGKMTNTR